MTKAVGDAIEQLGRVQQAAARLRCGVCQAVEQLADPGAEVRVDDGGLREAIDRLETRARSLPPGQRRTNLLAWIHVVARPAADRRARVTNAKVVVAEGGKHHLVDDLGEEVDVDDLREVAEQLDQATRTLSSTIDPGLG